MSTLASGSAEGVAGRRGRAAVAWRRLSRNSLSLAALAAIVAIIVLALALTALGADEFKFFVCGVVLGCDELLNIGQCHRVFARHDALGAVREARHAP